MANLMVSGPHFPTSICSHTFSPLLICCGSISKPLKMQPGIYTLVHLECLYVRGKPSPPWKTNKYTAGSDLSTYEGTYLCSCTHLAKWLIPPAPSSSHFQRKLARKWAALSSWSLYYYQTPNETLLKSYCKEQSLNTGHQSCLKSKMPPLTVTRSLGSTDAQANLVKVALWKLTLPLRAPSSRLTHVHFSRLGELLRFSTPLPWKPILLGFTAGSRWEAKLRNQAGSYIKLPHLTRYGQECAQTIPILNSWF